MPVFLSKEEVDSQGEEMEEYRGDLFKREFLREVQTFPQVRALFVRLLEDGWKIALASSAKGDELKIYKEMAQISDLLDTETSSDDTAKSKPHPDIFIAAMKGLEEVSPGDCVVVGDSPYDAEAAGKAGHSSCGFPVRRLSGRAAPQGGIRNALSRSRRLAPKLRAVVISSRASRETVRNISTAGRT